MVINDGGVRRLVPFVVVGLATSGQAVSDLVRFVKFCEPSGDKRCNNRRIGGCNDSFGKKNWRNGSPFAGESELANEMTGTSLE